MFCNFVLRDILETNIALFTPLLLEYLTTLVTSYFKDLSVKQI